MFLQFHDPVVLALCLAHDRDLQYLPDQTPRLTHLGCPFGEVDPQAAELATGPPLASVRFRRLLHGSIPTEAGLWPCTGGSLLIWNPADVAWDVHFGHLGWVMVLRYLQQLWPRLGLVTAGHWHGEDGPVRMHMDGRLGEQPVVRLSELKDAGPPFPVHFFMEDDRPLPGPCDTVGGLRRRLCLEPTLVEDD